MIVFHIFTQFHFRNDSDILSIDFVPCWIYSSAQTSGFVCFATHLSSLRRRKPIVDVIRIFKSASRSFDFFRHSSNLF
jgi:hypothetical protein